MSIIKIKPKSTAEIEAEESARVKADLAAIDLASIRSMREYIASRADAPKELKDLEAAAAQVRFVLGARPGRAAR